MSTYEFWREFRRLLGIDLFRRDLFIAVLIYALAPGNRKKFDEAARIPLKRIDHVAQLTDKPIDADERHSHDRP